ncbi:MAG: hypothetical protein HY026_02330 [Deltaproteobacteria bacterium]|nr:hypothetical protein [Deltaproteobacteria bacterium]
MAEKPKRTPAAKRPASPRVKQKDGTIIVPDQAIVAPWYLQGRNLITIIVSAILLLIFAFQWLGIKREETPLRGVQVYQPPKVSAQPMTISREPVKIAPQIISIKLLPVSPVKGDMIKAEVLTLNNATVRYQWAKNGEALPETKDTLSADFKGGDKITLAATPYIGKDKGISVSVFTYIVNSPPVITSSIHDSKFADNSFTYEVKAQDPDNDTLTYSLKAAPEGMTIDPKTGLIKWTVPSGFKGRVYVMASATDGAGGEGAQIFNIQVDQEQK